VLECIRGLKPILKPTGRESMRRHANKRTGFDLRIDARRPLATAKFESPLPHPLGLVPAGSNKFEALLASSPPRQWIVRERPGRGAGTLAGSRA
jgi:hypothetical protein